MKLSYELVKFLNKKITVTGREVLTLGVLIILLLVVFLGAKVAILGLITLFAIVVVLYIQVLADKGNNWARFIYYLLLTIVIIGFIYSLVGN